MAYKCLFMDNDIYTAQDVNDAISNVISGGVSGYPFSGNALSDLNTAIAELSNGGANYKGTSCLVVNDGGAYKISEGVCIMNDGAQIIFDEDGYEITPESGINQYIYLERDVLHNTINVVVSAQSGGQDTIPLAQINAAGTILDRRRFASAKISLLAEPQNIGVIKHISHEMMNPGDSFDVDIGFNGWEYIIFTVGNNYGCINFPDGSYTQSFPANNLANNLPYDYDWKNSVTRNGSVLHFENISNKISYGYDIEIEVR